MAKAIRQGVASETDQLLRVIFNGRRKGNLLLLPCPDGPPCPERKLIRRREPLGGVLRF